MKILVCSDTHGSADRLLTLCLEQKPDVLIHLGDHASDVQEIGYVLPQLPCCAVRGNNDWDDTPDERVCVWQGIGVYLTHGHRLGVWEGTGPLSARAAGQDCQIALYGHTHKGDIHRENGVLVMNPGSLNRPRDGSGGSYGMLEIKDATVTAKLLCWPQTK